MFQRPPNKRLSGTSKLWFDKETGDLANGTYPDGKVYEKGVLQDLTVEGHIPPEVEEPIEGESGSGGLTRKGDDPPEIIVPYLLHIYYDFALVVKTI